MPPTPGFPPNSGSSGSVQWHFQPPLVEAGSDAAHDHRPGTAKRRTIGSSDVSVSRQFQNAELLGQKTAIALVDCILGPLIEVGVPHRAVIAGDRRNANLYEWTRSEEHTSELQSRRDLVCRLLLEKKKKKKNIIKTNKKNK